MLRESGVPLFRPMVTLMALALPLDALAQLDEIVVTARKRQENLQEVPISVSVITEAQIARKGIKNLLDVTQQDPSIEFDQGFAQSDTRVVIRGLSAITGRQNAAILVDGIDVSTESISSGGGSTLLLNRLVDIARIEVVKGPQMVQYGRSAFNGAIQYITKDPAEELEVEVSTDVNDQEQYSGTASISGPVPLFDDALGATLTGTWWNDSGFYDNSLTGSDIGDDKGYAVSLTLLAEPVESLSFKFRAEYQDHKSQPSPIAFLPFDGELQAPQAAIDSGVVDCFTAIVDKTHTPALDDRNARIYDPSFTNITDLGPFCEYSLPFVSGKIPKPDEAQIRLGTNPFNPSVDYKGFHAQTTRLSLVGTWELPLGTFRSWTGYTDDDTSESQDAGEFGVAGQAPYLDANVDLFQFEQDKNVRQYSQEIRYDTNFEGPIDLSLGVLFWKEDVDNRANSLTVQASGSHCAWFSNSGITFDDLGLTTDGSGCPGYTEIAAAPFVGGGILFGNGEPYDGIQPYLNPSHTDRNTDHWSFYGMIDFELAPAWTLTLEGRFNHEKLDQYGPVFLNPGASGGASNWSVCGIFFRPCTSEFLFHAPGTYPPANGVADIGGPFWSQANFEAAYEQWDPNAPISDDDPRPLRAIIPDECLSDPSVQARLQNLDQGGTDQFDLFNPWCQGRLSRNDSWWSPKVTLDWNLTDDAMMYFSWSRAHKPGGFATGTIGSNGLKREVAEFEPEEMKVYEVGLHSTWLDNTLLFNIAGFFQDYSDKQTVISALGSDGRPVSKIANANAAEIWGTEVELQWNPARQMLGGDWAFSLLYTGLDTKYVNAEFDSLAPLTILTAGNCEPTTLPNTELPACTISYNGNELEGAPQNKVISTVRYTTPLSQDLSLFVEADFRWTDKRYVEVSNRSYVDAYSNTDLMLGVRGSNWDVIGYVTNVFDDDSVRTAYSGRPSIGCCFILGSGLDLNDAQPPLDRAVMVDLGFTSTAMLAPPRIVGVRASYRFGRL